MSELREYILHNPIDDQSNHHIPVASLQSTVSNMMGGKTKMIDFLVFRDRSDDDDSMDAFLSGKGW